MYDKNDMPNRLIRDLHVTFYEKESFLRLFGIFLVTENTEI